MNPLQIENIIFDLGGVIINLDIDATFRKFSKIFQREVKTEIFNDKEDYPFFKAYELGHIDDVTFRNHLRQLAGFHVEDHVLDDAWNAMLQQIPQERIDWISELTKDFNCVVLSNTNHIHIRHFEDVFSQSTPYERPGQLFKEVFYSFEIGQRKPDAGAFEHVLDKMGFDAEKTVLYDDLPENLETAKRLGIQTVYVERNALGKSQLPNGRG